MPALFPLNVSIASLCMAVFLEGFGRISPFGETFCDKCLISFGTT